MNPFRPTAGKMPPILIGRESDVGDFFQGLRDGAGAPGRLMLVTGQRGFGKTVLLTELGRIAHAEGWPVISETASEGVCARIIDELESHGPRILEAEVSPSINVAGVAGVSVGKLSVEPGVASRSLRLAIESRLKKVEPGKGVFISIDEVQAATRQDMVDIGTAIQHVIRDQDMQDVPDSQKKGVAFAFAGLPSVVDELLDDKVLTFLRRSQRHELAEVGIPDVRNAYVQTITENGKNIAEATALSAAESTMGFPYMVQLVGHYLWQSSEMRRSDVIEEEDVARAIPDAARAFEDAVCAPAFRGLSKAQKRFVLAMLSAQSDAVSLEGIAERAERGHAWARKYRQSLHDAHVIRVNGDGSTSFLIPYFASYLRRVIV
ncbi:MAG: ATP-binding protein [Coriobacteriales bacterium]|nr:ATP-binding protein [Coriobacteriales bacterium]